MRFYSRMKLIWFCTLSLSIHAGILFFPLKSNKKEVKKIVEISISEFKAVRHLNNVKQNEDQLSYYKSKIINKILPTKNELNVMKNINSQNETGTINSTSKSSNNSPITYNLKKIPYPKIAKDRGIEGKALIKVRINEKGDIIDTQLQKSSGFELLDKEALLAIKESKFYPAKNNNLNVESDIVIAYTFKLED